jgi:hypothetical protein
MRHILKIKIAALYDLGGLLFLLAPVKSENQRLLNFKSVKLPT